MTIRDHLRARHVDVDRYTVAVDEEEGVATFLLYDRAGAVAGYQQYRPAAGKEKKNHPREGRYFTYKTAGRLPVFGMETWQSSCPLFITEGIFDAVRLHNEGVSAIATLSNDPKWLRQWLWILQRPIYAVCDPGDSGKRLARYAHKSFTCAGRDLGDMNDNEVRDVVRHFA